MINENLKEKKIKKESRIFSGVHKNIRCRNCLIIDGYLEKEKFCKHCGAKLRR